MADVNSLHSDKEHDSSAIEADVEDDEMNNDGDIDQNKKKNKKRRKKFRDPKYSSGDSDGLSGAVEDEDIQDVDEMVAKINLDSKASLSKNHDLHEHSGCCSHGEQHVHHNGNPEIMDKTGAGSSISMEQLQQIQQYINLSKQQQGAPKNLDDAKMKQYQFWDTQPVPKFNEEVTENTAIDPDKPLDEIRSEPYSLPGGFEWDTLDINNSTVLQELYTLLNENYVEDDDNMFRFDYSSEFLLWALQPPGWKDIWHCGVRVSKNKKLVGFISAVPAELKIYEKKQHVVEINFLCVHKKLRSKRVAPVLIREITRRVNLQGIFQAVYTAGVVLPKPVSTCRYWHRSLNPRKLIEVKFSHLTRNMTMHRTLKLYKLPNKTKIEGFRKFMPGDVEETHQLLSNYLNKYDLAPVYSLEEFKHWFIPRPGIIDSYVVEKDGKLTDFVSFYTLPSTVMHHPTYKSLKAAYSFYNVCTSNSWSDLMQDALIVAKNDHFDVFNALDLAENREFLEKLKFGIGDGNLQYYLYNWKCPDMKPSQVGLVLQ